MQGIMQLQSFVIQYVKHVLYRTCKFKRTATRHVTCRNASKTLPRIPMGVKKKIEEKARDAGTVMRRFVRKEVILVMLVLDMQRCVCFGAACHGRDASCNFWQGGTIGAALSSVCTREGQEQKEQHRGRHKRGQSQDTFLCTV